MPFLPENIAGEFLKFFNTKIQSQVGINMLSSFKNEMIVTNNSSSQLFPNIHPRNIEEFFD